MWRETLLRTGSSSRRCLEVLKLDLLWYFQHRNYHLIPSNAYQQLFRKVFVYWGLATAALRRGRRTIVVCMLVG